MISKMAYSIYVGGEKYLIIILNNLLCKLLQDPGLVFGSERTPTHTQFCWAAQRIELNWHHGTQTSFVASSGMTITPTAREWKLVSWVLPVFGQSTSWCHAEWYHYIMCNGTSVMCPAKVFRIDKFVVYIRFILVTKIMIGSCNSKNYDQRC